MTPTTIHFDPLTLIPVPADWPAAGERAWGRAFEPEAGENSETRFVLQELLFLGCQPGDTFRPRRLATVRGILALEDQMLVAELLGARLIFRAGREFPPMSVRTFLKWTLRAVPEVSGRDPVVERAQAAAVARLIGQWRQSGKRFQHAPHPFGGPSPFVAHIHGIDPAFAGPPTPGELLVFCEDMLDKVPGLGLLLVDGVYDLPRRARDVLSAMLQDQHPGLSLFWKAPRWPFPLPPALTVRTALYRLSIL